MPGWKQWSQAALLGALALLVWSSPAPSETVTERPGSVDRDSEVSGDTDSLGADAVDSQAGTLSKTFNAPDPRRFRDFTEQEKQNQAPEAKIDLILSEGWSKDSVSESETAIGVDLLTNDITSANQFPILADGNLNSGSGGSGGSGGETPHWAAKVEAPEPIATFVRRQEDYQFTPTDMLYASGTDSASDLTELASYSTQFAQIEVPVDAISGDPPNSITAAIAVYTSGGVTFSQVNDIPFQIIETVNNYYIYRTQIPVLPMNNPSLAGKYSSAIVVYTTGEQEINIVPSE